MDLPNNFRSGVGTLNNKKEAYWRRLQNSIVLWSHDCSRGMAYFTFEGAYVARVGAHGSIVYNLVPSVSVILIAFNRVCRLYERLQ